MNDDLASLHDYAKWADARVARALSELTHDDYVREMGGGWPSLRATWVHLAGATWAWSERFAGRDATSLPKEDVLPAFPDAEKLLFEAHAALDLLLPTFSPERLAAPFTWRNLQGIEKTATFWTVVRHVVNHGTYHRGQIASMLRRLGAKPLSTDMVFWGIERFGEGR